MLQYVIRVRRYHEQPWSTVTTTKTEAEAQRILGSWISNTQMFEGHEIKIFPEEMYGSKKEANH